MLSGDHRNIIERDPSLPGLAILLDPEEFALSLQPFYPEYADDEARAKLRWLMQRGTLREYVREFSELMPKIFDLSEKEAFFSFTDGLKPWAK